MVQLLRDFRVKPDKALRDLIVGKDAPVKFIPRRIPNRAGRDAIDHFRGKALILQKAVPAVVRQNVADIKDHVFDFHHFRLQNFSQYSIGGQENQFKLILSF